MRVLMLTNSAAGNGAGAAVVARATKAISSGIRAAQVLRLPVDRADPADFARRLDRELGLADALVVAGGDGTVHYCLDVLRARGVPMYHLPLGTENLFAREFAMTSDPRGVLAGLARVREPRPIDLGTVKEQPCEPREPSEGAFRAMLPLGRGGTVRRFAIMASVGPDASVVGRVARDRTGPISHARYVGPIVRELLDPSIPVLSISVEGRELACDEPGLLVVANSRQYALRTDPARHARVDDGLLDVVFFPARGGLDAGLWLIRSRLRISLEEDSAMVGARYARGTEVRVVSRDPRLALQVDGEATPLRSPVDLTFSIEPHSLYVLEPARDARGRDADLRGGYG